MTTSDYKNETKRKKLEDILRDVLGSSLDWVAFDYPSGELRAELRPDCTVSFAQLERIAGLLGTKLINFRGWEGFYGTDVTPAEPNTVSLWIKGATLP